MPLEHFGVTWPAVQMAKTGLKLHGRFLDQPIQFVFPKHGGVAELADALDLGSSVPRTCRFDSCHPHLLRHMDLRRSL